MRGHGVDRREGGLRRGDGRLDPVILAFVLSEQSSVLLHLLLVMLFVLSLLVVPSVIGHVCRRVGAYFRPVRVLSERLRWSCSSQRPVQSTEPQSGDRWPLISTLSMLIHMLTKIRLLRITLAAVLADVRLQMFGLLVLRDMFQQILFVSKAFVTGVALKGLVRLVAAAVALKIR